MERRHDDLTIGGGEYQEGMQVFHYGSLGAFQGDLSHLSTRSIIETCVIPILLFGSENWIVSGGILKQLELLESLQIELPTIGTAHPPRISLISEVADE